ncbi:MAG: histidine phosphatase family protein, partial [Bacilli bacterium]|nr:histidine phosphatase family protein [Bacilli bacterium]
DFEFYDNILANHTEKGVEGMLNLIVRVRNFILELKKNYPNSTILLVTHGGLINAMQYCFKDIWAFEKMEILRLGNGEFIKYSL